MKNKLPKYYLFISLITFISILVVLIQKSYSNLMGPITSVKSSNLIKSINPNLNTEILDQIELQKEYRPEDINNTVWRRTSVQSLTPTP